MRSIDSIDEMYVNLYYIILMIFPMANADTRDGKNAWQWPMYWKSVSHQYLIALVSDFNKWFWILISVTTMNSVKKISIRFILCEQHVLSSYIVLLSYCVWILKDNWKEVVMSYDITFCVQLIRGGICKWAPKPIMVYWLHLLLTYFLDA